ncbi:MAG TPA: helix-turn-helix transcriptional regulator [Longimicrobiaceae bacterium]|nr:helix-turn-helix transcriptional regulator [Longimicrobiaceae bacterium]
MNEGWIRRQTETTEARRMYEQERLVVWATERIYEAMEEGGLSKADIARDLGTSRANVTGLLNGSRNMTLRTLADLAWVCGQRIEISLEPLRQGEFIASPVQLVRAVHPIIVKSTEFTDSEAGSPSLLDDTLAA